MSPVIIHVDMDYFYAAIEEREDSSLCGKAVVVCMYSGRGETSGSVSTCNYTARDAGIHSGMPCSRAKIIKPDAVFLPVRKDFYKSVSDSIMGIMRRYADNATSFEQISIDEAFLDITQNSAGDFNTAYYIAMHIKEEVKAQEHITCSVGIGPNKLIAKMASSVNKPDGITIVKPEDVQQFLKSIKLTKLWGIGKVTEERLLQMEIETIEQLAAHDVVELVTVFGRNKGTWLKNAAAGIDESIVKERGGSDQIGRMATLPENTRDVEVISTLMQKLVVNIIEKLNARGVSYKSVTITAINSNFNTRTKSRSLGSHVSDSSILYDTAMEMIGEHLAATSDEHNLRRIGVRVSNLQKNTGQKTLFDYAG